METISESNRPNDKGDFWKAFGRRSDITHSTGSDKTPEYPPATMDGTPGDPEESTGEPVPELG
jgi:hypothetical protein